MFKNKTIFFYVQFKILISFEFIIYLIVHILKSKELNKKIKKILVDSGTI